MTLDIQRTIQNVASIFNDAQLEVLCPKVYGLGKELRVLNLALHAVGNQIEIQSNLMNTRGIKSVIEHADFVLSEIAADKILSRLIHDRTCNVNSYINAFLPESKDRFSSNIVKEIERVAPELSKLKARLYPSNDKSGELVPGMVRTKPERERFKEITHDIKTLKNKLLVLTS